MMRAPSLGVVAHAATTPSSVERRRLQQDRVGDRELADVVEERRVAEHLELRLREAELAADRERELLHAPRVPGRVRVARVDGRRERLHGAVERSFSSRLACSSETFCAWIVSAASRSSRARAPRVREVRRLRLPHEEERESRTRRARRGRPRRRRSRSRRRRSRRRRSAAAAGRSAPARARRPSGSGSSSASASRVQARVDREVDDAGDDAAQARTIGRPRAARASAKTPAAESEASVIAPMSNSEPCRTVVRRALQSATTRRERERERGPRSEQRRAGERADGADRDRSLVEVQRERLSDARRATIASRPSRSPLVPSSTPATPAAMPTRPMRPSRSAREPRRAAGRMGRGSDATGSGSAARRKALTTRCGAGSWARRSGTEAGAVRRRSSAAVSVLRRATRLRPWSFAR